MQHLPNLPANDEALQAMLEARKPLVQQLFDILIKRRDTPQAYPTALEAMRIGAIEFDYVAQRLGYTPRALESALFFDRTGPDAEDLRHEFVDIVLAILTEGAPFLRQPAKPAAA